MSSETTKFKETVNRVSSLSNGLSGVLDSLNEIPKINIPIVKEISDISGVLSSATSFNESDEIGKTISKTLSLGSSLTSVASTVTQTIGNVADGLQYLSGTFASATSIASSAAKAVPVLNIVSGALDLGSTIVEAIDDPPTETADKWIAGLKAASGTLAITSGALALTGAGAPVAAVTGIASAACNATATVIENWEWIAETSESAWNAVTTGCEKAATNVGKWFDDSTAGIRATAGDFKVAWDGVSANTTTMFDEMGTTAETWWNKSKGLWTEGAAELGGHWGEFSDT